MDDELFDWDDANILHLAGHNISPEEAEEAILGDPIDIGFDVVHGEERSSSIGETAEGRILHVVIAFRGERMRVVTAFEAEKQWRMFYLEEKARRQ